HGTHVAGILAGNGSQSATSGGTAFQWRGMAPNAGIIDSGDLITLSNLATAINTNSLDLTNHSHAVSPDGSYDAQNQTVDQAIQGDGISSGSSVPRRPQVYSAGNNGTNAAWINNQAGFFSLTKQMKNAVVVGNWDVPRNDLVASSSMGPTHDGRIKPDVVAPGAWNIISTGTAGDVDCYATNNTNGYGPCGGTSMASPVVAGITALMLEGWQTTYLDASGTNIDQAAPAPATLRALVIQSTTDIVNNDVRNGTLADIDGDSNPANLAGVADGTGRAAATAGPDYATGWGLVDAQAAVDIMLDARDEHGLPVPNRIVQDSLQHLEVLEIDFAVDTDMISAGDDVRVTLAWDDVAGALQTPLASAALINDLDLVLVDPNGNTFYPWQLGHSIRDASDNLIASAAQTPGTTIFVDLPFRDEASIANASDNTSITLTSTPSTSSDYIPANAMTGAGVWVASKGRDHINNVEVVDIDNVNLVAGHWTLQVSGFDIQDGPQDFSVVGQPHPDLADLVAYSDDKVTIGAIGEDLELEFTVENVGDDVSESAVQYEIRLSTDFELGGDVILYTSANDAIGVLNPGDTLDVSTTVQIDSSDVIDLLGAGADFDDLIDNDVFLLVRVDSNDTVVAHGDVLENNETNIAFLQMAREADVVLVMDRSGSMDADVTVSNGVQSKLQVLQNSASLFLDLMRLDEGDQIAEVAFNLVSDVVFEDDTLVEIETGNLAAAQTAVDDLLADGATNMTDALLDAYDLLVDLDASGQVIPSDRQKVIVLFSDGVPTAGSPMDPRDLSTAAGDAVDLDSFEDAGIRIYSVGFGTEGEGGIAGIDIDLLEDLANVGDEGFYHVTGSVLDLDKFFVNAVAGAIDSEVIIDPVGSIGGQSEIDASEILVNSRDSRVTFVLTWDNQAEDLDLSVRTPSGVVIGDGNAATFGDRVSLTASDTYRLMEVHLPLSIGGEEEHAGSWTMMVNNDGTNTVAYSVSAITQSTIRMDTDFDDPPPGQDYFVPGDSSPLTVTLTGDDRLPLGYSNVSMTPVVPIANLNNMLAGAMISPAELATIPLESNGEVLSETQRLIMAY
ncbi:MAG: S8 family serine peptidase, partial [Planctomycetaceae bacterium]|nr:S8 family serine peptidase [Planctomycetaceae bacterium]